jgi:hypothetical protein
LNPTATTAVVNVTALSANGFAAPTSFQGLVIGPHALVALNINNQIVNAAQLALAVRAVQGTVVPVATESWTTPQAGAAVVGGGGPAATSWFPSVPTGPGDQSNVVLANFSIQPITATLSVKLPPYVISPFVVTVPAESIQSVTISPATRVPAVGHATVIVSSHHALVATLLTSYVGTSDHWLTAPAQPGTAQMVAVNGESFSAVRVSNPSATAVTVSFSTWFFTSSQHVDFTTGSLSIPSRGTSAVIVPKGLDGAWVLFSSPNPVAITATVARADQLNALSGGQ